MLYKAKGRSMAALVGNRQPRKDVDEQELAHEEQHSNDDKNNSTGK